MSSVIKLKKMEMRGITAGPNLSDDCSSVECQDLPPFSIIQGFCLKWDWGQPWKYRNKKGQWVNLNMLRKMKK